MLRLLVCGLACLPSCLPLLQLWLLVNTTESYVVVATGSALHP
jgi:hypothetical protein